MILTTCAACAAPLAHDAPRCVRCKIRYCDSTCQHDHSDIDATLDDLREATSTLEELARITRRVLGGAHPLTSAIEVALGSGRANLRARETQP